jgi:hypothetical protein
MPGDQVLQRRSMKAKSPRRIVASASPGGWKKNMYQLWASCSGSRARDDRKARGWGTEMVTMASKRQG